jgi:hypothetical protein
MARVLAVGLGNMGRSHALAHHRMGSQIVGPVNRSDVDLPQELQIYPGFARWRKVRRLRPIWSSSPPMPTAMQTWRFKR